MRLCIISFKECWQDASDQWMSDGGFPFQIAAIAALFAATTIVIVAVPPRAGGTPLPAAATIVPLRRPHGEDLRRKLAVVLALPYYLRMIAAQVRPADVVHTPLPGDIAFLGMLVALWFRKRLLARYGGSWAATTQTTLMNRVTKAVMRWFAGGRNIMLATGAGHTPPAAHMRWIFVSVVAHHELATVQPDYSRRPHTPLQLAYVGRLSSEKGVVYLVEAIARLKAAASCADLVPQVTLIGDGDQRAALAALVAQRNCSDVVHFAGQLDRAALLERLRSIDLCVLPSLTESFGKARLDAMLCGVPVVTTAVGFGREIVGADGERGWIIPVADASALAALLDQLVRNPVDWAALRQRCRAYVTTCTLEAWATTIAHLCREQWGCDLDGARPCAVLASGAEDA